MLVIMDMEWMDWCYKSTPTQLSALRVTPDWQEESRFDRIIRPESEQKCSWDHMAFTGYSKNAFLNASDAFTVMKDFSEWLNPEDVLCWWSEPTADTFKTIWRGLFHTAMPFPLRLIAPAIRENIRYRGSPLRGSAYAMAKTIGLPLIETEHCSADDVNVIRLLLRECQAKPETIPAYTPEERTAAEIPETTRGQSAYNPSLKYVLDLTHRRAHLASCSLIPPTSELKSMATMENVIRSLLPPCSCCKEEYWQFSHERSEENIRKMQLNFLYAEESRLFHKTSCVHVQHMPYPQIHGCIRYETAVQHGFRPCGFCKPKPADEKEPLHIINNTPFSLPLKRVDPFAFKSLSTSTKQKQAKPEKTIYDRTLSRYEQNAVKRHEQAIKERAAIPGNLTGIENRDAHVLSQSGFAFWAAEGYQSFHLRNCPKLKGLSHLHGYARFSDARRYGLTPCKMCKPSKKNDIIASVPMDQRIRKEEDKNKIDAICKRLHWQYENKKDGYYIETPVGKWKLISGTYPLEVYHINKVDTPDNQDNYHKQHRTFLSMTDTVEYIRRHDDALVRKENHSKSVNQISQSVPSLNLLFQNQLPLAHSSYRV